MDKITGRGLWYDARPSKQPPGTYPLAKNGIKFVHSDSDENEPGFGLEIATLPAPAIGVIETDDKAVIFSTDNTTSYIGYYDRQTNSYIAIIDDSAMPVDQKFGFRTDRYITGEFQRNFKNETIVAWTNKYDPPFILNCDNPSVSTLKDLLLFLQATAPTMVVNVDTGGVLDKGAYFVTMKYLKNDGASTGYVALSNANIVSNPNAGTVTDKALRIQLSNLDTSYDKIQVAIVSRINGDYKAYELDPIEIGPDTITVLYTGENIVTPIGLEEILIPYPVYTRVGTMGQLNDALYLADLEKEPELDLQRYANLVKLRVKSELVDATPPPDEHISGQKRSLMHQEVYAIYIRYHKTDGSGYTKPFLIPGNPAIAGDIAAATSPHELNLSAKVFQTQDTTRNIDTANKTVDTGIWLNENEVFPTTDSFDSSDIGGEDLRGTSVRHHRMPSIAFCKTNFYNGDGDYGKRKLDILGLQVSNVVLPTNLSDKLDGFEILIAKRNVSNSTVIGQSILLLAGQPNPQFGTDLNYMSTGGNWHTIATGDSSATGRAFNLTGGDAVIISGRNHIQATGALFTPPNPNSAGVPEMKFRFHSFDMLFNRPTVTPAYISAQLKMRVNNLNLEYPTGGYIEDGEMGSNRMPVIFIADYTKGTNPTVTPSTARVRVVEDTRYLANNALTGKWNNSDLETSFVGEFKWIGSTSDTTNNDLPLAIDYSTVNRTTFQRLAQRVQWEETYLVNLMDLKEDLYNSFYTQPLIASGDFVPLTSTDTIYPGDVFINDYTFHTYGWWDGVNSSGEDQTDATRYAGYKIIRRFVCEAVSNINLRYEVEGNIYSQWWPRQPLAAQPDSTTGYIYQFVRSIDPNQFGYSKDLNAVNDLANLTPYNPYFEDVTEFPYRIHRGGKLPRQGKARSWRTFLPLDYHEAKKNMGRIIKVLGKDDKLLIHHENALFATQDKVKLETDLLSITLGTGDIFQFEPQERMSAKQGYAGTQHDLAAIDTPWGYVFPDAKQGQMFKYKSDLKLINNGMNNFLNEFLFTKEKNSFGGNGITIGYDPEYNRILLTVKNLELTDDLDFAPNYEPTQDFIDSLTPDVSVVYKDGRFQIFKGEYVGVDYSCSTCGNPLPTEVTYNIDEDAPNGTVVGSLVYAPISPATADNQYVGFFIITPDTPFGLIGDQLIVLNSTLLDYETQSTWDIEVSFVTACGISAIAQQTVQVQDVNEPPYGDNQDITIFESLPTSTVITTVVGTDPEGLTITYALNTTGTPFSINSSTGEITLDSTLDVSITDTYELEIELSDPALNTSTLVITVHVSNQGLFFEPFDYICTSTTKEWTTIVIHDTDINGAILAIVDNTAGQFYNGYPIPTFPDEAASPDCPAPGAHNVEIENVDVTYDILSEIASNTTPAVGTYPIASGSTLEADQVGFTDQLGFNIDIPTTASIARLYVNNVPIQSQAISIGPVPVFFRFSLRTYLITDVIRVTLSLT